MLTAILKETLLKKFKFIFLEARKSNMPALKLNIYRAFGFKEIGIRKTIIYIDEDAIVF